MITCSNTDSSVHVQSKLPLCNSFLYPLVVGSISCQLSAAFTCINQTAYLVMLWAWILFCTQAVHLCSATQLQMEWRHNFTVVRNKLYSNLVVGDVVTVMSHLELNLPWIHSRLNIKHCSTTCNTALQPVILSIYSYLQQYHQYSEWWVLFSNNSKPLHHKAALQIGSLHEVFLSWF